MISYPEILLRLVVALLLGTIVGFERERKEHGAGMRTIALVTVGATLFTIMSAYGFMSLLGIAHVSLDPTRIASYIIAGIGFLGAGTIFMSRDGEKVRGLTTAATIWVMAAVGMACGAGLLLESLTVTLLVLLTLVVLQWVERIILPRYTTAHQHIEIVTSSASEEVIAKIYEILTHNGINVEKLRIHSSQDGDVIGISCHTQTASHLATTLAELNKLYGVSMINATQHSESSKQTLSTKKTD